MWRKNKGKGRRQVELGSGREGAWERLMNRDLRLRTLREKYEVQLSRARRGR